MARLRWILVIAIAALLVAACSRGSALAADKDSDSAAQQEVPEIAEADYSEIAWQWADSVLHTLTLEERVGQLFMPSVYAQSDPYTLQHVKRYVADYHVGGLILLKGNLHSAALLADTLQQLAPVGLFMAIDAEWGLAMRLSDAPRFPANGKLDHLTDEQLLYEYGREMARESRRAGLNMLLGPVMDVLPEDRRGGVIGLRSFGADPHRVAELAVAYARGAEDGNVLTVAKHFPGHGSPKEDSHTTLPSVNRTLNQMDSVDLYPFERYVESRLSAIMVGHLAVPALDPVHRSAAVSPVIIGDLLRDELGFSGLVLTDALNMEGAQGGTSVDAIRAGADIILAPRDTQKAINEVVSAIKDGRLPMEILNEHVRRILFYKYKVGLDHRERIPLQGIHEDVNSSLADSLRRQLEYPFLSHS